MKITIPKEYCRLFYAIAYCAEEKYEELPQLEIEISFKDLQGINYSREYKLNVDIDVDVKSDKEFNFVNYVIGQDR